VEIRGGKSNLDRFSSLFFPFSTQTIVDVCVRFNLILRSINFLFPRFHMFTLSIMPSLMFELWLFPKTKKNERWILEGVMGVKSKWIKFHMQTLASFNKENERHHAEREKSNCCGRRLTNWFTKSVSPFLYARGRQSCCIIHLKKKMKQIRQIGFMEAFLVYFCIFYAPKVELSNEVNVKSL
jgi:hypothetical protein